MNLKPFLIVIILAMYLSSVNAGIGLSSSPTKTHVINEKEILCQNYGIYNPWAKDASGYLEVSGDIVDLIDSVEIDGERSRIKDGRRTETLDLKSETLPRDATRVIFCFEAPKLSEDDCIFLGLGCRSFCEIEEQSFTGGISALEEVAGVSAGSGSVARGGVGSDLTLDVKCLGTPRSLVNLIIAIVILVLAIVVTITIFVIRKVQTKKPTTKTKQLRKKL